MKNSIKKEQSSIEEDIILLKDFTEGNFKRDKLENYKGSYKMGYFYYKDIQQAIEHILSDYKKNIKENEHKTEKIENQKAELAILNEKQKDFNKLQNTLSSYKGQFRRQEKENEKLRKQLNEENKRCMMLAIEKQDYFEKYRYHLQQNESLTKEFSNVIPILKIKDKIKSNKEIINKTNDGDLIHALNQENKVLQKLLGENNGNR